MAPFSRPVRAPFSRPVSVSALVPAAVRTSIGVYRLYADGLVVYVGRSVGHLYGRIRRAIRMVLNRDGVVVTGWSVAPANDEWDAYWRETSEFQKHRGLLNRIAPARPAGGEETCNYRNDCRGRRPGLRRA